MKTLDEFNFPDYETYKSNLASLDKFDFSNMTSEEIYHKYFDIAKTIPLCHKILKKNEFNKLKFYRARLNIDHTKEDISLISTFSFPPTIVCRENGRANLRKKTVFYCSDSPDSAIAECKPKNGDVGYLSVWNTVTNRNIKSGICLPRDLSDSNKWSVIAKNSFKSYEKLLKENEKNKQLNALHHFMNFKFKYEQSPYYLSSIIGNEVLYGDSRHDFLVYSSVINDRFCNMAFHPNSVLENLKLEKIIAFKIKDIASGSINLGRVGEVKNSRIIFRERAIDEEKLFKHI